MADRLRIAQVAPIASPVGPDSTSSIEQLVWLLSEELQRRGHDVTLFATGDSQTSARLHATFPQGYWSDEDLWKNWEFHEIMHAAAAFERAEEFDVIHSHVYHYGLPFSRLTKTSTVHTYHVNPDPDIVRSFSRYPGAQLVGVSYYHRRKFEEIASMPVVYNGIDTGSFPFSPSGGDYLLFLGHLIPRKRPLEAIQIAKQAGMPLVMAGKGGDYFQAEVEPLVDGELVQYVGPVNVAERNRLLAGAAALVFPSVWDPFGLVMIEAMACGTPVVALDRCAVPEIIDMGVTGYYARDVDSLVACIPDARALDRALVREQSRARFHYRRMTDEYEELYQSLIDERQPSTVAASHELVNR